MLAASSGTASTGEATLVKADPGVSSIMEGEQEEKRPAAIHLLGWSITQDAAAEAAVVEILDKKSGNVLAKAVFEKTAVGSGGNVTQFIPQGFSGGVNAINVSTGELIVKRTGGKSTVIVYYEQQ